MKKHLPYAHILEKAIARESKPEAAHSITPQKPVGLWTVTALHVKSDIQGSVTCSSAAPADAPGPTAVTGTSPPQPSHTVLLAGQSVARDTQPDLGLHISGLRKEVSRLECKLGNMKKNTNTDLENTNIKISGKTHSQTNRITLLEKRLEKLEMTKEISKEPFGTSALESVLTETVSIQEDLDNPPDQILKRSAPDKAVAPFEIATFLAPNSSRF